MIISDEQVRRAVEYLRTTCEYSDGCGRGQDVPDEFVLRVTEAVRELPDVRDERVAEARERCADALPDAEDIAAKMLGRIVSDSIR